MEQRQARFFGVVRHRQFAGGTLGGGSDRACHDKPTYADCSKILCANASEQRHRARILQLIEQTERPFSREQYTPGHVTASAFVTNPEHTELLLILHSKLQLWLQPGGHVEAEDGDIVASARREVLEEVGVSSWSWLRVCSMSMCT